MKIDIEKILLEIGDRIIQELQKNLEENKPGKNYNTIATGGLYGSFEKKVNENVLSIITEKEYVQYVDEGRSPGGVDGYAIFDWVQQRGIKFTDIKGKMMSYKRTSFLVWRSINRAGYEGIDLSKRSFLNVTDYIEDTVSKKYAEEIEKRIEPGLKIK